MAGTICAFRPKVSLYCMDHFILIVGACLFLWRKLNHFLIFVPMRGGVANEMRASRRFFCYGHEPVLRDFYI